MTGTLSRLIGRLLCSLNFHAEQIEKRFEAEGEHSIYGVVCQRCDAPRCTVGAVRLRAPPAPGSDRERRMKLQRAAARAWLEGELRRPAGDSFVWWG